MIKNNKITDKETLAVKQGQKLSLWMTTGLVCFEVSRSKEITSEVLDPITTILLLICHHKYQLQEDVNLIICEEVISNL